MSTQRLLLVHTNRYRFLRPAPIGISYLIPGLVSNGDTIEVLDLMFSRNPKADLKKAISNFKPNVVGFSIRNIDNQSMDKTLFFLPEVRDYIPIASDKNIKTVIGGSAVSTYPHKVFDFTGADFAICGQGEKPLPALLQAIEDKKQFDHIPGLMWRENGTIRSNPPLVEGYKSITSDWSYCNLSKYKRGFFFLNIVVKSGCPFNCIYCEYRNSMGTTIYERNIGDILSEINTAITKYKIRSFFLADPCFSYPLDYSKEVLRAIIKKRYAIQLFTNIIPIQGCFDSEFFELFKKAGGDFVNLGCESLSEQMLKVYKKPFNKSDVLQWAKLAKKHGLHIVPSILFGGPSENRDTVQETVSAMKEIPFIIINYGIGIRIYPNTILSDIAIKEGIISSQEELLIPKFYISKDLDIAWARKYIKSEFIKYLPRAAKMLPIGIRNFFNNR